MWIFSYDLHLIWFVLGFFTIFMVFFNGLIDLFEDKLPLFILEAFRYGKTLNGPVQSKIVSVIKVPKSWFLHFYIFSSIYVPYLLYLAYEVYIKDHRVPTYVRQSLDFVCTKSRSSDTSKEAVLLALTLLSIQSFRRLYECAFVNQKSSSTMNILHYLVGFAHYFSAGTGIICEAPSFAGRHDNTPMNTSNLLSLRTVLCVSVFLWAWIHQFRVHKIFANLKTVNPNKHGIPSGDLFALVSCPHYLCEVLIYTVLMMILGWSHITIVVVFLWVLVNQTVAAWMSHSWYRNHFKEYPSERKAIFPYIL